ncbi:unnamed protein product [Parnassius apollo]|uniref:(apollo) hypothetical protein n=1 Tax=Parnassius apollo TaxID=110799 RepID=A0A8S3XTA3_PARAO|nr:unnamed protein product [Parnassius apollo]
MPGGGNLVRSERYRKTPRTPRSSHARYYYTRSLVIDTRSKPRHQRSRCQSAPKVMDRSHSRSASPREPARPQHRPPSPPSPPAFENRAYQHDESDPNHNDSFTSNGPQQNGHSKEPNGDTKTLEAVNLELINLTPKNGNAKQKKDVEVDMNASNPYDEYFVPVNEHRKYMRGEKLYVTADKRGEKGGCKRPLCWTLLGLVVAAIVALIVLAATGILFTNSPTPLEPYNTSISSARALGGITHRTSHEQDQDNDHDQKPISNTTTVTVMITNTTTVMITIMNNPLKMSKMLYISSQEPTHVHDQDTTPSTEQHHGPQMQNDESDGHSMASEETSDKSMYVPRTLEGELEIDNEEFTAALEDPESDDYREFVATFSDALKRALFDRNTLENGDNDITIEVVKIRSGSIVVTYRIHWNPRYNAKPSEDLLTTSTLKANLNNYLAQNNRMISIYHIAEDKMLTRPVLDICQINNNGCEYGCEFDKRTLDFICTCPHGQIHDMKQPKKCMLLLDNSERIENTSHEGISTSNINISNPISEEEKPYTESVHIVSNETKQNTFDWKERNHDTSETTTENDGDLNFSHIFGNPSNENKEDETDFSKQQPESNEEHNTISTLDMNILQSTSLKPKTNATTVSEQSLTTTAHEPTAEPEPTLELHTDFNPVTVSYEQKNKNQDSELDETDPNPNPEPAPLPDYRPIFTTLSEPRPTPEPQPTTELMSYNTYTNSQSGVENDMSSEPKISTNFAASDHIENFTTTDVPSVFISEGKYDFKSDDNHGDQFETTTIPVSEPHTTYQPESTSEIISNFNESVSPKSSNSDKISTTENDWLENNTQKSQTLLSDTNTEDNTVLLNHSIELDFNRATDQRSSKTFDSELFSEETTRQTTTIQHLEEDKERTNTTFDDLLFDQITKSDEQPSTKKTTIENIDELIDQTTSVVSISNIFAGRKSKDNESMNNESMETTTMAILTGVEETREMFNNRSVVINANDDKEQKLDKSLFENVPINLTKLEHIETTTPALETLTVYSITKQNKDFNIDQNLMTVLQKNNATDLHNTKIQNNGTTEKDFSEGDITFDAISKLYNRSSKSFGNQSNIEQTTEMNDVLRETAETTTSSDWLSETVTEINYQEIINENNIFKTTEAPVTKFDDLMGRGQNKDDFEPDYLNMGSNISKNLEHDEPLYGMIQDYDNEESAIKRVKNEPGKDEDIETSKHNMIEATNQNNQIEENVTIDKPTTEKEKVFETTTVSEYIYKISLNDSNNNSISTSNTITTHPVPPVWENSEDDMNFTVKELPKQIIDVTLAQSEFSTTISPTSITVNLPQNDNEEIVNAFESPILTDNVTQGNNLNVTIYEISNHSDNHSVEKSVSHQSAEYDDHETEMNPFLPEIENNKSLVKKLQEGHDLEPLSVNETQNENTEEQPHGSPDGNMIYNRTVHLSNGTTSSSEQHKMYLNDETFSNLLTQNNSHSTEEESRPLFDIIKDTDTTPSSIVQLDNESKESSEAIPISTFLLDTDDLDTKELFDTEKMKSEISRKLETVLTPKELYETTTETKSKIGEENAFLSVVPIDQESLEKKENLKTNYERENFPELNLISDSPKKSDRRTVEPSNINSVINNEA